MAAPSTSNSLSLPARSVTHGLPLLESAVHATLWQALQNAATRFPEHSIDYVQFDGKVISQSYPELHDEALRILAGLQALGLKPGNRALFQFEHNQHFLPAFWACALGGIVPIPLGLPPTFETDNAIVSKLLNAWRVLGEPIILSSEALQPALEKLALRSGASTLRIGTIEALRQHAPSAQVHESKPDDQALFLLTSGSTGMPKVVVLTHRNILARSAATTQMNRFSSDDVSVNWMPLDHVGGIVMFHLHDLCIGCRQVHLRSDYILSDPLRWLEALESYRATHTWAPNFAFGLINDQLEDQNSRKWDLHRLRFILNGGEAIVSKTARRFLELLAPHGLPTTAMRPAWGMSETSSGVTFSSRFTRAATRDSDAFTEVGGPIPGTSVRIVDREDQPVAEGKIGSLQVRGASVTSGYLDNPTLNQESFSSDGWFKTGDLGVLRDGQLTITGREKDVIIINGANFHSHEIEAIVESLEGVETSFTAACGVRTAGQDTEQLAVFYSPSESFRNDLPSLEKQIRRVLVEQLSANPDIIFALERSQIPKTGIGKIQRAQLKRQFEAGELKSLLAMSVATPSWFWRRAWKPEPIAPENASLRRQWFFIDNSPGWVNLISQLQAAGQQIEVVRLSSESSSNISASHAPTSYSTEHYETIFSSLLAKGPPDQIVYTCLTHDESAENIFRFVRQLARSPFGDVACSLRVLTQNAQAAVPGAEVKADRAALVGLLRSLNEEMSALNVSLIDFSDWAREKEAITAELAAPVRSKEVALRGDERLVARLEPISNNQSLSADPIKTGGHYLISGGLGGIGAALAEYLADQYDAKVCLLGRTPAELLATEQKKQLLRLQKTYPEIRYASVDVTDLAQLRAIVASVEATAQATLAGIFHLAGFYQPRLLAEETEDSFAASLRVKLLGARNLAAVLENHPDALCVFFSSVLGHFGGYLHGAYAAANSALDALAYELRQKNLRSFSIGWSTWKNRGMNRGLENGDITRAKGYLEIDVSEGMTSLIFALRGPDAHILIGLDAQSRQLRNELGATTIASTSGLRVAPRTETEKALAKIWMEVLKRPDVGVHDNFFEIGGKSLHAARIFARIDKQFSRSLPLATLFTSPTVEALAKQIEAQVPTTSSLCRLDALQTHGHLPPLFCIPGGASDNIVFRELAASLGNDQPFYGIQARGLDATGLDSELAEIEEIAAAFLREIRSIQPQGPYFLAGHCFGGVIAYEIAQILTKAGEEVRLLGLIDSMVSDVLPTNMKVSIWDKIAHHRAMTQSETLYGKLKYVWGKTIGYREAKESRQRLHESFSRISELHRRYIIKPYAGALTLLMARDSFFTTRPDRDPRLYWNKMVGGNAEIVYISGGHATMLQAPHVDDLARQLADRLARGRARN